MKSRTVGVTLFITASSVAGFALWKARRGNAERPAVTEEQRAFAEPGTESAAAARSSAAPARRERPPAFVPAAPAPGKPQLDPARVAMVTTEIGVRMLARQVVLAAQMGLTAEQTQQFTDTLEAFNDAIVSAFQAHVLDVEAKQGRASDAELDAYFAAIAEADEKFRGRFEAIDPKVKRAIESGDFHPMALPDGRVSANALTLAERYPQYMHRLTQRF